MLVCPQCGYRMIGVGTNPDQAVEAASAGLQAHQEQQHGMPLSLERLFTDVRAAQKH